MCRGLYVSSDKRVYPVNTYLYLYKNVCCGANKKCITEALLMVNHYVRFSWRNEKNMKTPYFLDEKITSSGPVLYQNVSVECYHVLITLIATMV